MDRTTILVVASLGTLLTACNPRTPPATPGSHALHGAAAPQGATPAPTPAPNPAAPATPAETMPTAETQVLGYLHGFYAQQVELASLAVERANDAGLRTWAKNVLDGHRASDVKLQEMATARAITLPTSPATVAALDDAKHKELVKRLQGLRGVPFDDAFLEAANKAHDAAWTQIQNARGTIRDADVLGYLDTTGRSFQQIRDEAAKRRTTRRGAL
ncbi:MAG: hypothetical protein RLZZ299_405 [Pseudomonadota bacterium]|jgi:predicted outer membrane protein